MKCEVCGRELPPHKGRGRPRLKHHECLRFETYLAAAEKELEKITFADAEHVKMVRRRLFNITNQNLQRHQVKMEGKGDQQ